MCVIEEIQKAIEFFSLPSANTAPSAPNLAISLLCYSCFELSLRKTSVPEKCCWTFLQDLARPTLESSQHYSSRLVALICIDPWHFRFFFMCVFPCKDLSIKMNSRWSETWDPPASVFPVLRAEVSPTMPDFCIYIIPHFFSFLLSSSSSFSQMFIEYLMHAKYTEHSH